MMLPKEFTQKERGAVWRLIGYGFQTTINVGNTPEVARGVALRGVQPFIADLLAKPEMRARVRAGDLSDIGDFQ